MLDFLTVFHSSSSFFRFIFGNFASLFRCCGVARAATYSLQTHIIVFGKSFAERKGEYDQDKMHNARYDDANDELALPDQPLGEDLIAALGNRNID